MLKSWVGTLTGKAEWEAAASPPGEAFAGFVEKTPASSFAS